MKLELAVSTNLSRLREISSSPRERESDKPERASASMSNGAGISIQLSVSARARDFEISHERVSKRLSVSVRSGIQRSSFGKQQLFFVSCFGTREACELVLYLIR